MPLDPQVRLLLDAIASMNLPELHTGTPDEARQLSRFRASAAPRGPDMHVEDLRVPGPHREIPVRLYRPFGSEGREPLPALVWFHGGGFVIGSVPEADPVCRSIAASAGLLVASVEYRLAPEHPFPAAPEDCYAALCAIAARAKELRLDPDRVAVGGDSAGGNLAAVVSMMAKDRGGPPIALQVLVYPVADSVSIETPSHLENADGYFLTRNAILWFREHYVPRASDRENPYVSPLHRADLRGLPPAWVLTAEFDPLRDEGEMYAERLKEAGVPTTMSRYDGMIHGFFSMIPFLDGGGRAHAELAKVLQGALAHRSFRQTT